MDTQTALGRRDGDDHGAGDAARTSAAACCTVRRPVLAVTFRPGTVTAADPDAVTGFLDALAAAVQRERGWR
jgi:hypothetical protein